jgi:AcrR family transcriptional regulator
MTHQSPTAPLRRRGRPAAHTRDQALDAATRLFWERGYEGTSFADLVAAMRIGHTTFYSEFGNKEDLYREAAKHYVKEYAGFYFDALNSGEGTRAAFQAVMEASARAFTREGLPRGCMVSTAERISRRDRARFVRIWAIFGVSPKVCCPSG